MKILILAIVALAAIVGFAFFLDQKSPASPEIAPANVISASGEKPWIEVLTGSVFEFDEKGKLIKELKTGDVLEEKRTIDAGTGALANIYFGDGSVLMIDSETKIELQKGEFQKTSGKLSVKIGMTLGRVYSQIKNLATLDSEWQVETPNAVAAVRGTAFGVEFTKGKSIIVVSENTVDVAAKDAATNTIIESSKTTVSKKEFVTINDKDIPQIKAERKTLKIEKVGNEMLNRTWLKRAIEQEKTTETIKIEENKNNIENKRLESTIQTNTGIREPIAVLAPKELKIISKNSLEKIFEDENVKFEAVLVFSNGSEKAITSEVTWQVLGGIGIIGKDGTFLPKLDPSVSEFGSAFGNIIAIWKDKTTLKEFLGKTSIFKVEARIIKEEIQNTLEPRG